MAFLHINDDDLRRRCTALNDQAYRAGQPNRKLAGVIAAQRMQSQCTEFKQVACQVLVS